MEGRFEAAKSAVEDYARIFPGRFYLEVHNHGLLAQAAVMVGLMEIGRGLGLPLVAANDVHYLHQEQSELHDILLCSQQHLTLADEQRLRFLSSEYYFKSASEMAAAFPHLPEALANTVEIADRCQVELPRSSSRDAGHIAWNRFKLHQALEVVGQALDLDEDEVEFLSDWILKNEGDAPAELARAARENPGVAKLLSLAAGLEGLPCHTSTQAASLDTDDQLE